MLPEIWTIVTNTSLFIQNSNPTASAVCLPGMGPKKHEIVPKFSKPGHLIHTTKLPLIVNSSSRVSPRYTTGGHLGQKLECQVPHQNKNCPDLISTDHVESLQLQSSTSHILQNNLERCQKQVAPNKNQLQYSAKSITDFVNKEWTDRWKSSYSLGFFKKISRDLSQR